MEEKADSQGGLPMNITEKFEKKRKEAQNNEMNRQQRVKVLADKIVSTLSDKETIESIENYLIENGAVSIKDFGCLCQGGFCSWQKGLETLLQPLIQEWNKKGISVRPSLKLDFRVKAGYGSSYKKVMTIEELKQWNHAKS